MLKEYQFRQFENDPPDRYIQIMIDSKNPLDVQLRRISGDGWNSLDWSDTLQTGIITHKHSGIKVKVLGSEYEEAPALLKALKCALYDLAILNALDPSYLPRCKVKAEALIARIEGVAK